MNRKKVRKPRKPRNFSDASMTAQLDFYLGGAPVFIAAPGISAKECRRLARWLDRAAEYLSSREDKK